MGIPSLNAIPALRVCLMVYITTDHVSTDSRATTHIHVHPLSQESIRHSCRAEKELQNIDFFAKKVFYYRNVYRIFFWVGGGGGGGFFFFTYRLVLVLKCQM